MLSLVLLLLGQLVEICAAAGKWKYMRIITDFMIQVRTMSDAELAFLHDCMFTDMGFHFQGNDELTETFHWLFARLVPGHRSGTARFKAIERLTCTMHSSEPGCNLGSLSGATKAPTGFQNTDIYIHGAVMNKLKGAFRTGDWTDQDGNKHGYEEQAGVAGPLPAHAADVQKLGRAISRADIKTNVFGSGASSVRRSNPPSVELTVAKALAAAEKRENQTAAASQSKIEEVAYTRAEMFADLKSYENHSGTPLPSVVEEALEVRHQSDVNTSHRTWHAGPF